MRFGESLFCFVYPEGGKAEERITPPEPDGSEGATYMIRGKMMSVISRKSLREHVPVRFTGILYYIPTVTYFYGHFFKERNGINFNKIVDIAVLYDILPVSDKLEL